MVDYSFLFLGDSYTAGEGIAKTYSWPNQLIRSIEQGELVKISSGIIAQTGWTTRDLINTLSDSNLHIIYDLVFLLIGVNNQYQGLPILEYRNQFLSLAESIKRYSGGNPKNVFVLSIPDWGKTPFAQSHKTNCSNISEQIDKFNMENKKISDFFGFHHIDITTITRELSNETSFLAPDGLHPSKKLYKIWVDLIRPNVLKALVLK